MSGAVPLLPLYAFMAWTGKNSTFLPLLVVGATYRVEVQILAWWWGEKFPYCTVRGRRASSLAVSRAEMLICVGLLWFFEGRVKVNCRSWCPKYVHMHICMWLYVKALCTPWRRVWEWRCSSTHYCGSSRRWMVAFMPRSCYRWKRPRCAFEGWLVPVLDVV